VRTASGTTRRPGPQRVSLRQDFIALCTFTLLPFAAAGGRIFLRYAEGSRRHNEAL
jgi:hypothetical protein